MKSNVDDHGNTSFLWGVVNIGTQTEGSDVHGNWTRWARRGLVPQIGVANDYWRRFREDHDHVEDLGCNSVRITIEWSRIEPEEGKYDAKVIAHYRNILQDLKKRKIITMVGLWHWNVPMWCEENYGMHNRRVVQNFEKFAQYICDHLGHMIDYVVVLNEPMVYVYTSYIGGTRPPFIRSYIKAYRVMQHMIAMHRCVYALWKGAYPNAMIGSTYLWNDESGAQKTIAQNIYMYIKKYLTVTHIIRAVLPQSDFIGINYYTSNRFFFGKSGGRWGIHGINDWHDPSVWQKFPQGLYRVLMQAKKYHKPIMILENGKPTNEGLDDQDRQKFLLQTISCMQNAIDDDADVRGYFHYCLCDSYEWDSGYDFKFGLMEIDRTTGARTCRDSFFVYKKIIAEKRG